MKRALGLLFLGVFSMCNASVGKLVPLPWDTPEVSKVIAENILYEGIVTGAVRSIEIEDSNEELIDLVEVNHPRIRPLALFNVTYQNSYPEFSKVRKSLYLLLLKMLEILPGNIGIAYFEGLRPLYKQKEYFDKKMREILEVLPNKEDAYQETTKHVSPFINNIPPHCTGAAIDMTLFVVEKSGEAYLLDMGKFDVIFGPNNQQETFSENTTIKQRVNRLILLGAAIEVGFVNYGYEWWHYGYGDRMWAYVKKQPKALFGLAVEKNDPILEINKEAYLDQF